ncbi:MAG: gamma-glutamyltransferase [Candidatus Krumholzibacteriia bacterium]
MRFPSLPLRVLVLIVSALGSAAARADPQTATGREAMVVTAHPLASRAGRDILRAGGSACDAAVAAAFALAVVEPYSSGLGGGGLVLVHSAADGGVRALDCRETAPAGAWRDMFVRDGAADPELSRTGGLAVATPALVRGLAELHRAGGRLPWGDLLQPAIALARDGFPVDAELRARIDEEASRLDPAAQAVFRPGGVTPAVGARLVQADLARTLATLATGGAEAFYAGPLAAALVAGARGAGGLLTVADLAACRPRWREPVRGTYRGAEVWSMPPPSAGGVLLVEMLNVLAGRDLAAAGWGAADSWFGLAGAMRFAFADRARWFGDPDFHPVPVARLTSPGYADSLRARLDRAFAPPTPAGAPAESPHTTHLSVVDGAGNAVAATLTINLSFGSGVLAPGTGVILNDEMDDFSAQPGAPNYFGLVGGEANAIAPGKRPLSSMTPTIVLRDGRPWLVLGSPGGSRIITAVLQVLVNVSDFGFDLATAVRAPRIHQQWTPPETGCEPLAVAPEVAAILRARGLTLAPRGAVGNVQAILVDPRTGERTGVSDPRGSGEPAGY